MWSLSVLKVDEKFSRRLEFSARMILQTLDHLLTPGQLLISPGLSGSIHNRLKGVTFLESLCKLF